MGREPQQEKPSGRSSGITLQGGPAGISGSATVIRPPDRPGTRHRPPRAVAERRAKRKAEKNSREEKTPRWQRELSKGSPRATFVVGALLSFPGAAYLAALDKLGKLHYSNAATVLVVIGFCLVELILLEGPIIAFSIWPEQTPTAINRAKGWAGVHGSVLAICGLSVVAAGLAAIGVGELA
jgi:Sap, sulfolipid-1-addressing protein